MTAWSRVQLKTTDVRAMAANMGERAGEMSASTMAATANLRKTAEESAARVGSAVQGGVQVRTRLRMITWQPGCVSTGAFVRFSVGLTRAGVGRQHAHVRAHGMEGRARMEAAAAKSHAEMQAGKTGRAVNKRLKGDGPPVRFPSQYNSP